MLTKPLVQVSFDDIRTLVANGIAEGRLLDYKESLPGMTDAEKKEFLGDVSSFANTVGGHLIYGVSERGGIPLSIPGLEIESDEDTKLRLEQLIQSAIEPRLRNDMVVVSDGAGKSVLLIHVPRSYAGPHRVVFKESNQFYARNSSGKYRMDTFQLRDAFLLADKVTGLIRHFKEERTRLILAGETPLPMSPGGKLVLHFVPLSSFDRGAEVKIHLLDEGTARLEPVYAHGWSTRYTLEGRLGYSSSRERQTLSYIHYYRTGVVEAVEGVLLRDEGPIPSIAFERELLSAVPRILRTLQEIGVNPPIYFFLTLVGAKGMKMGVDRFLCGLDDEDLAAIDRDILALPETEIQSYNTTPTVVLRPLFDLVWNACGFPRSPYFDKDGNWTKG